MVFGGFTYIPLQAASDFIGFFRLLTGLPFSRKNTTFLNGPKIKTQTKGCGGPCRKSRSSGKSLHLLGGARAYSETLLAKTTIGGSSLCSCGVKCRGLGRHWDCPDTSVPGAERTSTGWGGLAKKNRGGNHIHQPFWASCLTMFCPPARTSEQTLQPCFCTWLPGPSQSMTHTGDNSHLFAGWAKAEILKGGEINH